MSATIDPILSTDGYTVIWDLEDGSPMPPDGAQYKVLREDIADNDGDLVRTIRFIELVDDH
jgi:hypothetical protein